MAAQIPPHIQDLIDRYLDGSATSAELDRLDKWYHSEESKTVEVSGTESRERLKSRIKSRVMASVAEDVERSTGPETPARPLFPSLLRVAGMVVLLIAVGYFLKTRLDMRGANEGGFVHFTETKDIPSPGPSAYLVRKDHSILDLGRVVSGENLSADGILSDEEGTIYFAGKASPSDPSGPIETMEVVVPKGNLFELVLPDGSRVALNADSRLSFPSHFEGHERHVSLVGEAFFQVKADPDRPFFVNTENQEIRVTGTQFNVSAYPDEQNERTALVEGKVSLKNRRSNEWFPLMPGEAGTVAQESTSIEPYTSLESIVAWKSNVFVFEQESIESILRKVSRWYDVRFEWNERADTDRSNLFSGKIRKQAGLKEVLTMLGLVAHVDFHQQNDVLIVSKRKNQ